MKINRQIIFVGLLIAFCAILYGYRMGGIGLSDPDETFYAETAKEMLQFKSFATPMIFGQPQFEKPPMFYWLIMLSSLFFGMTEFAVRLVPAFFGIVGVVTVYFLGRRMFNQKTAVYASFILASNFLYLGLSRCALTDVVFTAFILLSLAFFYFGYQDEERRRMNLCLCFLFCALAALTKGPLGILIPAVTILPFLFISRDIKFLKQVPWFWGGLIFVLVAFPWYILMALKHQDFLKSFLYYENFQRFFVAEHRSSNRWYFYPSVLMGSTFPWSILFPLIFVIKEKVYKKSLLFLICWFWAPLIFFTAAQSKLASYILPLYPALSLILARAISKIEESASCGKSVVIGKVISSLLAMVFLSGFAVSLFWLKGNFPEFFGVHVFLVTAIFAGIISAIVSLWRGRYKLAVIFNAAMVFIFILVLMSKIGIAQGAFSDNDLPRLIKENSSNLKNEIVCSKIHARGVYFYTGRKVVVINDEKKAFFRPHPIEVISHDQEVKNYFNSKESILCVVEKDSMERINSLVSNRDNQILNKKFDRYVILSKPSK